MKAFGLYLSAVLAAASAVGLVAWGLADAAGQPTVAASWGLAVAVQMVAFGVARAFRDRQRLMLGWGLGSVLRVVALVLYALFVARLWRAPLTPALLSFLAMLFVTMLIEPVFLKR